MAKLFAPGKIGPYTLSHRVVFAPMTRLRSDKLDTPLPLMADFYGQRASSGGFLIAESAAISIASRSYFGAPGIYLPEHVIGWKAVTDAVHAKGRPHLLADISWRPSESPGHCRCFNAGRTVGRALQRHGQNGCRLCRTPHRSGRF